MTQGNMLARYKIIHELGRGAAGAVYAARDRETTEVVALKRFDPALLNKPEAVERLLKLTRSARLLKHPNIVGIHDAAEVGGTAYVAMEMLEGQNLRSMLDAGPIPIARAIQIAHGVASGLAHAHLEGVVHGAVKPSNIIVLRSGIVKITDFGTGQLEQAALLSGARAGRFSTMAPEQLRGGAVDHRCDIFALGALFYEMLTHRPPFKGDSPKEVLENVVRTKPPLPSELNPHVPRALDAIVLSMLAGEPVARMPGASILVRELQGLEEGLGLDSGASARTEEPTASVPPPDPVPPTPEPVLRTPEPVLRTPEPSQFRNDPPMQHAPRFARDDEARDTIGARIREDLPPAEEFQHRTRMSHDEAFDHEKAMLMMDREIARARASRSRPSIIASLALVLAILSIGFTGYLYYSSGPHVLALAASRLQEALTKASEASRPSAPPPVAEVTKESAAEGTKEPAAEVSKEPVAEASKEPVAEASKEPVVVAGAIKEPPSASETPKESPVPQQPLVSEPAPPVQKESVVARTTEEPAAGSAAPAKEPPRATQTTATAKVSEPRPGMARLILDVSPRGEIYIDGKHYGTTPPVTTVVLEPGMRQIEVRSGSRKPYLTYMMVQAGDERRIRHNFNAGRAINPPGRPPWHNSSYTVR